MIEKSITLIGMAGVGKSTIGKTLSKHYNCPFIDTDNVIEAQYKKSIFQLIQDTSNARFMQIEEDIVLALALSQPRIIATGGSVVYSKKAMTFLKKHTMILYLKDTITTIKNRIKNLEKRGMISLQARSFEAIFEERARLYETYAHKTFQLNYPPKSRSLKHQLTQFLDT